MHTLVQNLDLILVTVLLVVFLWLTMHISHHNRRKRHAIRMAAAEAAGRQHWTCFGWLWGVAAVCFISGLLLWAYIDSSIEASLGTKAEAAAAAMTEAVDGVVDHLAD